MKKSRKKTLIVLTCISAFFLAAFTVLFFLSPVFAGINYSEGILNAFLALERLFYVPFVGGAQGLELALSIVALILSGVWVITFVLGIILSCLKKRFVYLSFIPVMVFAIYTGLALLAFGQAYANMLISGHTPSVVLGIFYLFLGCFGFILTYITYALGLAWANRQAEEEEPAIAPVAEEAADPEIIEEGQELAPVPEIEEPAVSSEPVEEPSSEPEPVEDPAPVPEEEVKPEPAEQKSEGNQVNVNVNNAPNGNGLDQNSLASLLREVVRDIVRDEIARNNANSPEKPQQVPAGNQTITGATFGGPLVVQYFNGGINGVTPSAPQVVEAPKPAPAQAEEKKPEPVKEEPKPEPKPEPVKEEPKPAPAPVVEVKVEQQPTPLFVKKPEEPGKPEAPKYERIGFAERLLKSDKELHDLYNELKNEILSYGVKSRISAVGDTFRLHKKMYVRITVAGKSLKLYFALDPKDYEGSTIPVQDASGKDMYAEIPLVFKVKSGLSVRRCKELIQAVMEKDNLEQGEIGKVNWIKELKAEMAADKKKEKEEE